MITNFDYACLLYVEIEVPATSATYSGTVLFTGNGGVGISITSALSTSKRYIKMYVDCRNNRLNVIYNNSTATSGNITAYWQNRTGVGNVKAVRFSATGAGSPTVPSGAIMRVYGVKAA